MLQDWTNIQQKRAAATRLMKHFGWQRGKYLLQYIYLNTKSWSDPWNVQESSCEINNKSGMEAENQFNDSTEYNMGAFDIAVMVIV